MSDFLTVLAALWPWIIGACLAVAWGAAVESANPRPGRLRAALTLGLLLASIVYGAALVVWLVLP